MWKSSNMYSVIERPMRLAALVLVVSSLYALRVRSQLAATFSDVSPSFCCNPEPGPQVVPSPIDASEIANESPNYVQVVTKNAFTEGLDSICYTYLSMANGTYLQLIGRRYSDGSFKIEKFIVAELSGYPGVFRCQGLTDESGSSTVILDIVHLGRACPGLRVYYKNYLASRCETLRIANQDEIDYIQADSSSRDSTDYCKGNVSSVISCQQFRRTNIKTLPNQLNRVCVVQFNGARCINADSVLPQDAYVLSETGSSC